MEELRGLDAYLTGGNYSSRYLIITCPVCDDATKVEAETEYGATYWTPDSCVNCHEYFTGEEVYEDYYPEDEYV